MVLSQGVDGAAEGWRPRVSQCGPVRFSTQLDGGADEGPFSWWGHEDSNWLGGEAPSLNTHWQHLNRYCRPVRVCACLQVVIRSKGAWEDSDDEDMMVYEIGGEGDDHSDVQRPHDVSPDLTEDDLNSLNSLASSRAGDSASQAMPEVNSFSGVPSGSAGCIDLPCLRDC